MSWGNEAIHLSSFIFHLSSFIAIRMFPPKKYEGTMSEELVTCVVCKRKFMWSYEKQRDYRAKKYDPPKRCPTCASHARYDHPPRARAAKRSAPVWHSAALGDSTPMPQPTPTSPRPSVRNPTYVIYGLAILILVIAALIVLFWMLGG